MDFEIAYNRVDWGFVREVLLQKGFPPTMVLRYATGLGEGTGWGVNVNGEIGPFSECEGSASREPTLPYSLLSSWWILWRP
jgi:hypothetical protein